MRAAFYEATKPSGLGTARPVRRPQVRYRLRLPTVPLRNRLHLFHGKMDHRVSFPR